MAVDKNKSDPRISVADRQRQALELRKAGLSYDLIARRLKYRSRSGAHKAVQTALKKTLREPADELRQLELERLDAMLLGLWPQAQRGNQGAVDRVLKIMERRAKLLGLDDFPGSTEDKPMIVKILRGISMDDL